MRFIFQCVIRNNTNINKGDNILIWIINNKVPIVLTLKQTIDN